VEHIKDAIFSLQASVNKTAMPYWNQTLPFLTI
jgi:hypothetical protein